MTLDHLRHARAKMAARAHNLRAVRATARDSGIPSIAEDANARLRALLASAPPRVTPRALTRAARALHSWAANPQHGNEPHAVFERESADAHAHALVRAARALRDAPERNIDLGLWEMMMGEVTPAEFAARQARPLTARAAARLIAEDAARTGWLRTHTPTARRTLLASLRRTLETEGGLT